MARKYKTKYLGLPPDTIITVVAQQGERIFIKDMKYSEALEKKKNNKKFKYRFYQKGYCYESEK